MWAGLQNGLTTEAGPLWAGLKAHFVSEVLGYLTAFAAARHLP